MKATEIEKAIKDKDAGGDYFPSPLNPQKIVIEQGTRIVLADLKHRATLGTANAVRKRLARRFSIIGDAYNFQILVNGTKIGVEDRDYLKKLQFIWGLGNSNVYIDAAVNAKKSHTFDGDVEFPNKKYVVQGWIGTVDKPKNLETDEGGNINGIVLLARGRLVQENLMDAFNDSGLYTKYVTGQIDADFLDLDDLADIATSNRQRIVEDDDRFVLLKNYVWKCLKTIQGQWSEWRGENAVEEAVQNPALKDWYESLSDTAKKYAEKLFAKIETLHFDSDGPKREVYKHAILAFERLRLKEDL